MIKISKALRFLSLATAAITSPSSSFADTTTDTSVLSEATSIPPDYIDIPSMPVFNPPPPPPGLPPSPLPPEDLWSPYEGDIAVRIQENATTLALRESDLLLDQQIYTEIANDLTLIYESIPSVSAATPWSDYVTSNVLVGVSEAIDLQIANNTFAPWNELKALYGGSILKRSIRSSGITYSFVFESILDSQRLAQQIEATWPDIRFAEPNFHIGDGHDITRYPIPRWYAFTVKWGDCPAGCINTNTRLVVIENGSPILLDFEETHARIQFLALNMAPFRAASGDQIDIASIKARFNLKAFPETILESTVHLFYQDDSDQWIELSDSLLLQQTDFLKDWWAVCRFPFSSNSFATILNFDPTPHRAKDVLGSRFRYPNDWINQADLGWIYDRQYPWLWHNQLGWLYLDESSSSENAWWSYHPQLGWLWIPLSDLYPFIWSNGRWLWSQPGSTLPRWFFDYGINQWFSID